MPSSPLLPTPEELVKMLISLKLLGITAKIWAFTKTKRHFTKGEVVKELQGIFSTCTVFLDEVFSLVGSCF